MAFIFPIILGIPTDFHIFQRGRLYHQPVILNHHESSLTIIKSPLNTIKSPLNLVYMRGHGMCHHWCHVSFASPVRKFVFVHVNAMCLGKPMATRQRWNMVCDLTGMIINVGKTRIKQPFLMVYTTHVWWFWGCFLIVLTTLVGLVRGIIAKRHAFSSVKLV